MKNCVVHTAPELFALGYLKGAEEVACVRLLSIGPMVPVGPWVDKMGLLVGEVAPRYLNVVISSMGNMLGTAKSLADFAPDQADTNPALAQHSPAAVADGNKAREKKHLTAYSPRTALQGLFTPGQVNIAVLKPIRAKRESLAIDLEVLENYDLVVSPSYVSARFGELGVGVHPCDPEEFSEVVSSYLPQEAIA